MALKIAVIGGDGVGPEVVNTALKVLETAAKADNLDYTTTALDYGGTRYLKTGQVISDDEVAGLRAYDAIFLGAVGHPDVKPGVLEQGLLLKLRFALDQYINLRPVRLYPGVATPLANKGPDDIDFVCVRENTEDLYCGNGGIARKGTPHEISTQEMITTRFGVERCLRYAYNLARERKAAGHPGQLTLVHKTNVLVYAGDTWFRAFEEIGQAEFPEIERVYHHVDACCMYMATTPERYDTIVVPNMFGDIITDLGA
ncbi:MAG: isocitrate/isopropylmalate family dehydrogenase, partial [Phycisphaeraceae bacterium]